MMEPLWLAVALPVIVIGAIVVSYNRFVRQRAALDNSWANLDTELQRRHDLIPNLVATARGYAEHEQQTFVAVVAARDRAAATADVTDRSDREAELTSGLRQLLALGEAYPELRADEGFLRLHRELITTENRIQASRRLHNGNVRDLNRRVESVPSNLVAGLFGISRRSYLEFEAAAAEVPSVELS